MNTSLRALVIACALSATAAAQAQEPQPTFGFGLSTALVSSSNGPLETGGVSVSLSLLRGRLRFEPELGFDTGERNHWAGGGVGVLAGIDWTVGLGAGLLYEVARFERTALYAGGRLNLLWMEVTVVSGTLRAQRLAAVAGGEYFVAPAVSVALEAQASVVAVQFPDIADAHSTALGTAAVLAFRFYVP